MTDLQVNAQENQVRASEQAANVARKVVKTNLMATGPVNVGLLHFGKNVMDGDTFGEALDNSIDQTVKNYQELAATLKKCAKKMEPKDDIEKNLMTVALTGALGGLGGLALPAIAVKRTVEAFSNKNESEN